MSMSLQDPEPGHDPAKRGIRNGQSKENVMAVVKEVEGTSSSTIAKVVDVASVM